MSDPLRGGSSAGGKVPGPPGPVDVKISASRVTKYQPCTIDLRPARVVHYPDLNACLVNERQSNGGNHKHEDNVDCRAVHFGYAIPVSVVPLTSRPELAELVLDSKAELSPAATSYLLQHHPQLRGNEMQTQAAPQQDDEDIAAIAKQISDHAEAIYQTWKSRGLAPAELRSVSSSAAPSFAPVLSSPHRHKHEPTPKPAINKTSKPVIVSPKPVLSPKPVSPKPHTVDLMNPSQLELLVNSFVEEDKARQARGSSIQTAVRKFDQQAALNNITPAAVSTKVPKKATTFNSFPQENNVSGLTTWPLKNHVHKQPQQPQEVIKNELPAVQQQQFSPVRPSSPLSNKYATLPAKHKENNAVFLEEVAREEERLINALKTGCVVEPNKRNKLSDDEMSGLSRVDYAKIRYHAAQQNPLTRQRLEDAREIENSVQQQQQHSAVSEARSRFEAPSAVEAWKPAAEWVPGKYQVDGTGALAPELPNVPISSQRRASKASVPHPELTSQQRQHIRERAGPPSSAVLNPVRPFLTRGSVAERVLIFEKCPPAAESLLLEKRPAITTWRTGNEVHCKTQLWNLLSVVSDSPGPRMTYATPRDVTSSRVSPGHTPPSLRSPTSHHAPIPRFHFPRGRPVPAHETEAAKLAVVAVFKGLPGERATRQHFADITKACGMPMYWKLPLFLACGGGDPGSCGSVSLQAFLDMWARLCGSGHDEAAKFVWVLTRGQRSWLAPEDLAPLVQDVVDTHPGLSFLKEATEFHFRYVHTVISRMFYCANRSWSGRLSIPEIRRSQILAAIRQLEATADINQVTQFFSYEHFYVIYCKFWELDRDHDLFIDRADLSRHNDHALSSRIIERIFSGAVTRGRNSKPPGKQQQAAELTAQQQLMSYTEFVWFLLSEEDKTHPTAIEYWFRCMDLDGDGFLSMYELEYFYEEQLQRMEAIGVDTLPFEDCLCQMLDMLRPEVPGKVSLRDLKRCKLSPLFFDTFFNLEKFLEHEQRDPFATQAREPAPDGTEMSDWDRFAAEEYEMLVAEENGGMADPPDDMLLYDDLTDEDEADHDVLSPNLDQLEELQAARRQQRDTEDAWGSADNDEDSGDYAGDSDDYSF